MNRFAEYCLQLAVDPVGESALFATDATIWAISLRDPKVIWQRPVAGHFWNRAIVSELDDVGIYDDRDVGLRCVTLSSGQSRWILTEEEEGNYTKLGIDQLSGCLVLSPGVRPAGATWRDLKTGALRKSEPDTDCILFPAGRIGVSLRHFPCRNAIGIYQDEMLRCELFFSAFAIIDVAMTEASIAIVTPEGFLCCYDAESGRLRWQIRDPELPACRVARFGGRPQFAAFFESGSVLLIDEMAGSRDEAYRFAIPPARFAFFASGTSALTSRGERLDIADGYAEDIIQGVISPFRTFPRRRLLP